MKNLSLTLYCFCCLLLIAEQSRSQASLVAQVQVPTAGANPDGFLVWNAKMYFSSQYNYFGIVNSPYSALWSTDGTTAGSQVIRNISTGTNFGATSAKFFFIGNDPSSTLAFPLGVWVSDGTNAGTQLVKSFTTKFVKNLVTNSTKAFFWTTDLNTGVEELWISDGTAGGTVLLKSLQYETQYTTNQIVMNNKLYFAANDGSAGNELWVSDGTVGGTVLLKDINTTFAGASASPDNFAVFNNKLYFSATNANNNIELWTSDGTAANTTMLADIHPTGSSEPKGFAIMGAKLYFSATNGTNGNELWVTDGTSVSMVKDINTTGSVSASSNPIGMTANGTTLFFMADDGANGKELWKSDGTAGNTVLVKNIRAGSGSITENPFRASLVVANGLLFFVANDGVNGSELWKSDGTAANTLMIGDVQPGSGSGLYSNGLPAALYVFNNKVYFKADNLINGSEPWMSDGTTISLLKDSNPSSQSVEALISRQLFPSFSNNVGEAKFWVASANKIFFTATDPAAGAEPWVTDGTQAGTFRLKDINTGVGGSDPNGFTLYNGNVYFTAYDPTNGREIWKTDGTIAGTSLLKNIDPTVRFTGPTDITVYNGKIFFATNNSANGIELWVSDGTEAGTLMLKDINSGINSSSPKNFTVYNSKLYFAATDGANGNELWVTDGTAANTTLVKDIYSGSTGSDPYGLTVYNSKLYFGAKDAANGIELWRTDGTGANTTLVANISTSVSRPNGNPYGFTEMNGSLYFAADDGTLLPSFVGAFTLWKTDGTTTQKVKDINPITDAAPFGFTVFNNKLYFTALDGATGYEMWKSDGTAAGTTLVQDLLPGAGGGAPFGYMVFNSKLYFFGGDNTSGYEPRSMNTSNTIQLVQDILPGLAGSVTQSYVVMNNDLYFWAMGSNNSTALYKIAGGACASTLTPTGAINTDQKASVSVISTGTNTISNPAKVVYQARFVELNPGFAANTGSVFTAKNGGCN
jgi:ELWxxDGT repeat protein